MKQRTTDEWAKASADALIGNYRQQPLAIVKGQGCVVHGADGREYLDMTAGIAVLGLGHSHPKWVEKVSSQLGKLVHTSNLYLVPNQIESAEKIISKCFGEKVFFCNSGAEANEAALKLARRYQAQINDRPERQLFVATTGSFHGRSMATVAVTGQEKYRSDFGELVGPVEFVPFGDIGAMSAVLARREACAVIIEPLQAEGGIRVPPPGYLASLRKLCSETDTLLIFDEVQTGVGRTGEWFGHHHDNVVPDVMTLAKGLGGGIAVGAIVTSERAAAGLSYRPPGAVPHASTFGGNPLATAGVLATFEIIEEEGLVDRSKKMGEYLAKQLEPLVAKYDFVQEVRGLGLLQGLALDFPAGEVTAPAREEGLLLSVAGGTVVRFAPPFVVTEAQVDRAVSIVDKILSKR